MHKKEKFLAEGCGWVRNAIIFTLAGIFAISMLVIAAVYFIPPKTENPLPESSISMADTQQTDLEEYPYLLRTYEGKLALFSTDLVKPDMVFDVYVRTLPEFDRDQLERGVRVPDYEKLTSLIEDYIS